jgi:hypothetical protein
MEEKDIQTPKTTIQVLNTEKQLIARKAIKLNSDEDMNQYIKTKVENYQKQYTFTLKYSNAITKILKFFISSLNEKLTNTILENKIILKFFRDISSLYQIFSDQINLANCGFYEQMNTPKLFDESFKSTLKQTQKTLDKTFSELSNNLKSKILAKGPFSQIDSINNKISIIQKEFNKLIEEIEKRSKEIKKNYTGKYEELFNMLNPSADNKKTKINYTIEEIQDFIIIEIDLLKMINKLIRSINSFMLQMKEYFSQINLSLIDHSKLTGEVMLIYLQESKKLYNPELLNQLEQIEKHYEEMNKPEYELQLKITKIFHDEQSKNKMNVLLYELLQILWDYGFITVENKSDAEKFEINNYATIEMFLEMLISFNPKPFEINYDCFVNEIIDIKRTSGLFGSWKASKLITTKQNHLIIVDEPIDTENIKKVFQLSKSIIRPKDDKKHNYTFEIIVNKKTKLMNFTGTFLYEALNDVCFNNIIHKYGNRNENGDDSQSKKAMNNNIDAKTDLK